MCGICGWVDAAAGFGDRALLERMTDAMRHRGPDEGTGVLFRQAALGFRRLAILDLDGGQQPFESEDGAVAGICNGEIYNYPELRDWLRARGHVLRTTCDAEVVPHLYEELGMDFVTRLRGMFAIAIWDGRRGELHLARDHFGIKPLYYTEHAGCLLFSSEIRPLLEAGVPAEMDLQAIWHYLSFQYVPDPLTALRASTACRLRTAWSGRRKGACAPRGTGRWNSRRRRAQTL